METKTIQPVPGRKTGKASAIRKLKCKYPELTKSEIARRVNCSIQNVDQVLDRFLDGHSSEDLKQFQESKADIYDSLQVRILESITKDKLAKEKVWPSVAAAGLLEDKARTIRGQATGINVSVLLDLVQALKG